MKYHGKGGVAYLAASGAGEAVNVANLTEWSLTTEADTAEVTSLGDDWKSFVRGTAGWSGNLTGFFADDADVPFDAFDDANKVACYLYPSKDAPAQYWYGYVWPTGTSVNAPVSGPVGIAMPFTGDGALGRQ